MIRLLTHSEIDKQLWDRCVDQSRQSVIYGTSWYLDIVSPGWNALVEGNYEAVFPLTWRKKFGIYYLYQPAFTQQLGVFSPAKEYLRHAENFLKAIPEQYRLVEINLSAENQLSTVSEYYESTQRITHHLDLNKSYADIEKGYSENTRRNIRKFVKSGFHISPMDKVDELVNIFRQNRGKDIDTLKDKDYRILLLLQEEAHKRGLSFIRAVRDQEGKVQGGVLFMKSGKDYILLFSAVTEAGKMMAALPAIIDSFIREMSGQDGLLDFEGSMDPGLARFYKSFGSREIVYLQIRKNRLPLIFRWLK